MFNVISVAASDMKISEAALTAVFGYIVVFVGLAVLMAVLYIMAAVFKAHDSKNKAVAVESSAAKENITVEAVQNTEQLAPGSAGHVKLYDVPDKDAAMIMAVVADKMQKPLNELRFISIKEVK